MLRNIIPVSVIIPTLNRHSVLTKTVQSLCEGEYVPKQIIIIDQTSTPIESSAFGSIYGTELIIKHLTVASSSHARNVGISESSEEILLFCDDDILINKDTLFRLYSEISKSQVGLVAAIHYQDNLYFENKKSSILKELGGTLLGMKKFWRKDGYVIKSNMRGRYSYSIKSIANTEWAMGYFFCIKRSILSSLDHYFDENLIRYAYAEDLDFTYRYCVNAKKQGFLTIVDPELYVNHLASKEWRVPKQEEVNYVYINRRYLSWKLFPSKYHYRLAMCIFDHLYLFSQLRNKKYAREISNALKLCKKNNERIKSGYIYSIIEGVAK